MIIKEIIKKILGISNIDRVSERLIKKSIKLYHSGNLLNKIRAIRLYNKISSKYNTYFAPSANIADDIYIAHSQGITIGRTATIGSGCKIYPYAAIIASLSGDEERWIKKERRHAIVGKNCTIGYGCKIIGPINIGDNVIIGAGAIITKDVPSNCTVINVNQILDKKSIR